LEGKLIPTAQVPCKHLITSTAYEYDPTCKVFRAKVFNMAAYMKNATPIHENHKAFKMAKNMMATYSKLTPLFIEALSLTFCSFW
jgi:hypothetical protein